MELYPAIDLRGGKVVRLRQGEASAETRYGADPVAQAEHFAEAGFSYLHIVDLDSALARAPHSTNETTANHRSILEILKRVSLPVQPRGRDSLTANCRDLVKLRGCPPLGLYLGGAPAPRI